MAANTLGGENSLYAQVREQRLLGFLLFLISDIVIFSSFIFNYLYLRNTVAVWPPPGVGKADLYVAAVNSIVLFGSGATMHYAIEAFKNGKRSTFVGFIVGTIVLGSLFLGGQAYEYAHLLQLHTTWPGNTYGSSFFTLTGLHGFHVFVGVIFLCIVLWQALRGTYTQERYFGLTAATLYWHFVDVIWVALFTLLYVY
jgi:cytochrome c oxidase subunit 3